MPPSRDFDRVPPERRGQTARRITAFFGPYRGKVAVVFVAIIATSLIGLLNPYLLKLLTDEVIVGHQFENLNLYVGLMIAAPILSGLIGVGQSYLNNLIGQSVMQDLRNALYAHLQRMPLRFFTATRTGEIQSRLANDVGGVQAVVTDTDMPEMDGYHFARALRRLPGLADLPVVALAAQATPSVMAAASACGIAAVAGKFDRRALLESVARLLEAAETAPRDIELRIISELAA